MNEFQRRVDELIEEFGGYWEPFQMLAALVEEVGELADELLKVEGGLRETAVGRGGSRRNSATFSSRSPA